MDQQQFTDPATKAELLDLIRREHDLLEGTMALLDQQQIEAPVLDGGWSVKDVMSHLAHWEQFTIQRLAARSDAQALKAAEADFKTMSEDGINARVYETTHLQPLPEVRTAFNRSYEEIVATVESIPEGDLFARDRFLIWDGEPIWELIAGNTYTHYREHNDAIRSWLDNR